MLPHPVMQTPYFSLSVIYSPRIQAPNDEMASPHILKTFLFNNAPLWYTRPNALIIDGHG